ncbi:MAG: hypothetical protein SF070_08490 [Gemmatimonadota bacterium]|nr:hypothetical protein [Gemmatimonadota bacterium]
MTHTPLKDPSDKLITALEGWTRPRSKHHWKPGRSAMELARAWLRSGETACPEELRALLDSHDATRGIALKNGRPEHVTPLPERGEGRNHDLWLRGEGSLGRTTLCVEAKADEPFGERLGKQIQVARKRQPNTAAAERARALLTLLFGKDCNPEAAPWRDLRYQLITGTAGSALQAVTDNSAAAVFIVHEFRSTLTSADKLAANHADLEAFLSTLHPGSPPLTAGQLMGPIPLPRTALLPAGMPLYVGKAVTEVGER